MEKNNLSHNNTYFLFFVQLGDTVHGEIVVMKDT